MTNDQRMLQALLRRELSLFVRYGFREISGEGDYLHAWYIDAIIHILELVRLGEIRRLVITLPPRHLKSVIVSTCWPAWLLGLNPALRIIATSYGQDLAEKLARDCLRIMDSTFYRAAFPNLALIRRSNADFETSEGGGRLSTSLNGPLTGRGADLILIDDPLKAADVMSDTARKAAIEWLTNVLMSRLNDQKTGAIVLVMQRLHQNDLAGELLERGGWHELRLPAIAPEEALISIGGGRTYRRAEGAILHPARQSRETLEAIRTEIGSVAFAAQYLQDPLPAEGNVIKAAWLRTYAPFDPLAGPGQIVQSWDTASKDGLMNDWSACVTAHVHRSEVRILHVFRERLAFPALKRAAIRLAREHQARTILVEDHASGTQLIQALRSEQPAGVSLPIARRPTNDKISRVAGASGQIEGGQLSLPHDAPWLAEFKSELLGFPNARFDDQVDALTQLISWVLQRSWYDTDHGIGMPIFV